MKKSKNFSVTVIGYHYFAVMSVVNSMEDVRKYLIAKKDILSQQLAAVNLAILTLQQYVGEDIDANQQVRSLSNCSNWHQNANPARSIKYTNNIYHRVPTLADEVVSLLKAENRFLHIREIAQNLAEQNGDDVNKTFKKITRNIYYFKKAGRIVKIQASTFVRDTFWGLGEWLDAEGNIRAGHEFDPEHKLEKWKQDYLPNH